MAEQNELRDAVNDVFIVQGNIDVIKDEMSQLKAVIDKDAEEINRLKKVETRKLENEDKLKTMGELLKGKQDELLRLMSFLKDNDVVLTLPKKANRQTRL